jgi:sulfite reductase (NADPH) flavoprotein alpha-component
MSMPMPASFAAPVLPDSAPFSAEQRAWLNGFFAGLLSLDGAGVAALSPAEGASLLAGGAAVAEEDDGAPWHDQTLPLPERMKLAEGRPLPRRMMAAMAQQDCGQCGYVCESYAKALADGAETRLNLCAPGGKETNRMLKALAAELGDAPATPAPSTPAIAATAEPRGYSRAAPAPAVFLSRRRLNGEASAKETHHVEFDLSRAGISYEPGDAFGIYPNNSVALVKSIGRHLGIPLGEPISAEGQTRSLGDWLTHVKALSPAPDALFALLAAEAVDAAEKARLSRMADGEGADGYDVLAALLAFPHLAPPPYRLIEALDPLAPRLYSISSSPRANPGRVSLTVDVVRYQVDERVRFGVASTFLGERVQPGDPVRIYIQKAHAFALPGDPATPIIMVGPGTGIAPFRAFLQDRLVTRAKGPAWLFFGHQKQATDFFYKDELEEFQAKGALTRLSTAWSRDAAPKTYVQDRMREQGADLADWLDQGAHFYICGDASRMARDVETALADILVAHRGQDEATARAAIAALKAAGRYQADVY